MALWLSLFLLTPVAFIAPVVLMNRAVGASMGRDLPQVLALCGPAIRQWEPGAFSPAREWPTTREWKRDSVLLFMRWDRGWYVFFDEQGKAVDFVKTSSPLEGRYIFADVFAMPTTVHIPRDLLASVDRQARRKKVSRNRYIIGALQARLEAEAATDSWPEQLLAGMRAWRADPAHARAARELADQVRASRRSKKLVRL